MYAATYEACEAAFYHRETVLQVPGLSVPREAAELDPSEFVAVKHVNLHKKTREDVLVDNINADDKTVQMKNPPPVQDVTVQAAPDVTVHLGPLTFDPHPQAGNDVVEDTSLAAANDQARPRKDTGLVPG